MVKMAKVINVYHNFKTFTSLAGKMAHKPRSLPHRPDGLSRTSRTHIMAAENWLIKAVLEPPLTCAQCTQTDTHIHKLIFKD